MKLFLLFLLAEIIIYYVLMRIKLYFDVLYRRDDSNDELIVKILIFKSIQLYTMRVPAIEFSAGAHSFSPWLKTKITAGSDRQDIKTRVNHEQRDKIYNRHPLRLRRAINLFWGIFQKYGKFMRKTISSLRCEYLSWHTACGTGDAATTALLTGCLWSLKGTVLKRIKAHSELQAKPSLSVKPDWEDKQFATAFKCIFSIRIGHVITAAIKALFIRNKGVLENG